MLILDIINEYKLIAKYKNLRRTIKNPEEAWSKGTKGDIVIVPGWHETWHAFIYIANILNKEGYRIHVIDDFYTIRTCDELAQLVVKKVKELNGTNIVLLSHSKGGIVAKYALDKYKEIKDNVYKIIAIASPFKGTYTAYLNFHNIDELKPDSKIITELVPEISNSRIYNYYPKWDNHIIPNKNLHLDGAFNKVININGHTRIMESQELGTELLKLL